ncbi:hypothetical protein NLG97_g3623 [Lecanicillium saksenae]|uniref:Uncharacterized protein n=1 Tax=Lecanicillium saksenae TaxID=468837 RepID=A0ACC1QXS9_9HYPO|nr:hypothetical protein NLG97_g3623 [Lecanicillium saksenae]
MVPLENAAPVKAEDSESPLPYCQSVLDWASPEEERDNPGKLDRSGQPLASFHKLRAQESNHVLGNWTVDHAIHVAKWESYEAGNERAFNLPYTLRFHWELLDVILELEGLQEISHYLGQDPNAGFIPNLEVKISELEDKVATAVESLKNGGFIVKGGIRRLWVPFFPVESQFQTVRLAAPTGKLPKSIVEGLEKLGIGHYPHFKKTTPPPIQGRYATRIINFSLEKHLNLERSSNQIAPYEAIDEKYRKPVTASQQKKRKIDHMIDGRLEALKKRTDTYESLLDESLDIINHLAKSSDGLGDRINALKKQRTQLQTASQLALAELWQDVDAATESEKAC